tara:strand:+ start:5735 stop:5989 length:255 start_codon:yes stop_codon:yes gene_type:complete
MYSYLYTDRITHKVNNKKTPTCKKKQVRVGGVGKCSTLLCSYGKGDEITRLRNPLQYPLVPLRKEGYSNVSVQIQPLPQTGIII